MAQLRLLCLILVIGFLGWLHRDLFFSSEQGPSETEAFSGSSIRKYFEIFLAGFGITSVLLFVILLLGWFTLRNIVLLAVAFSILSPVVRRKSAKPSTSVRLAPYLFSCLFFGLVTLGIGKVAKPYEAAILADDASVYLASSFQLTRSGSLVYRDKLVQEMNPDERNLLFHNRFPMDTTGPNIRFPGGVRIVNLSGSQVTFSFYHLFPAWLALGIETLGTPGFLSLMSLYFLISLIAMFLLGHRLAGMPVGIGISLLSLLFFPQLYFSRMPTSELLSQSLFLSGLAVFFSSDTPHLLPESRQRLVGVLWGALLLCRLDSLLVLILSLILVFSCISEYAKNIQKSRTLILFLTLFLLLALFYQMDRAEYLYLSSSSFFASNHSIVFLGIEVLNSAFRFNQEHPSISKLLLLTVLAGLIVGSKFRVSGEKEFKTYRLRAILCCGFVVVILMPVLGLHSGWDRLVRCVGWISVYFSPVVFSLLGAGVIFFVHRLSRQKDARGLWAVLILLFFAVAIYLIRPVVPIDQPWAIRRFVPMGFPLFSLISLSGWFYFAQRVSHNSRSVTQALFFILVAFISVSFLYKSSYLWKETLFEDLYSQLDALSEKIPRQALIVIPDSMAGVHLELSLEFSFQRDVLLLPLNHEINRKLSGTVVSYLDRQIRKRLVVILIDRKEDLADLILRPEFRLDFQFAETLSFPIVARTKEMIFPNKSKPFSIDLVAYALRQRTENQSDKLEIRYDDPNITFVHFHPKETEFRWSTEESLIQDFTYRTGGNRIRIILSTAAPHPYFHMDDLKIELLINDDVPADFLKRQKGEFLFTVDGTRVTRITKIAVRSKTFVPLQNGLNSDCRRLGIPFIRITLQKE
jgi:hypothetical protein